MNYNSIVSHPGEAVKPQPRIVAAGSKVAVVTGDRVVGRWPNIRAGVRMARLACVRTVAPRLADQLLDRLMAGGSEADRRLQGAVEYIQGLHTGLAAEIEAWLAEQRSQVALTVATRKYGYGQTCSLQDPVLWLHKAGQERREFEPGQRPTMLDLDRELLAEGYVPVDEAETGIKPIEVRHNMIIRRYCREVI